MNELDPRLKQIIKEQLSLLVDEIGRKELILNNIERAWIQMPQALPNPRPIARDYASVCSTLSGEGAHDPDETRLDFHTDWALGSCCPVGPPGVSGPQGVK
jgi:hypothetical protein